jgi:hypothetical protein
MGNLTAAYTEGRKVGQGYADKQQAFVFRIPVYNAMPDSPVSFTSTGNPNNYLKTLSVTGQSLTPAFQGKTVKYSLVVENDVTSVKVAATAVASTSTVSGTGTVSLNTGTNTVKVKCKSQSGKTKTYTLTITRKEADAGDIELASDVYRLGETYITGIQPGTKAKALLKNITAGEGTMKLVTSSGKEQTGVIATGNQLEVYDSDNKKVSTYTLVIYGDVNGDGSINVLDLIKVNRHLLGLDTLKGCYLEAGDADRGNEGLNVLDLIYINRHILDISTIQQ